MRIAGRLLALVASLLFHLPLHGGWRLVGVPSPWPRRFLASVGWIVGARLRIVGQPPVRNVAILANHLSWIDIMLLANATGAAFVAKGELASVPLVGWLCRMNETVFVSRGDRLSIGDQVAALRRALATGRPVALFPEGTTGDGETLLPFKPALLAALDPPPPGVAVQPVRIDYGAPGLAWIGDEPALAHAARVLGRRGGFEAVLTFLPPIDPVGGRKAIAAAAREAIAAAAPLGKAGGTA